MLHLSITCSLFGKWCLIPKHINIKGGRFDLNKTDRNVIINVNAIRSCKKYICCVENHSPLFKEGTGMEERTQPV